MYKSEAITQNIKFADYLFIKHDGEFKRLSEFVGVPDSPYTFWFCEGPCGEFFKNDPKEHTERQRGCYTCQAEFALG